jgi:threonine dehydrogenase-like Zn-dependent dehydrogenase
MKHYEIVFPARLRFDLQPCEVPEALGPNEVRGPTICSLISPGTELAWATGETFPIRPGYASVFRVDEVGRQVTGIDTGTVLFCMGPHRSYQQVEARFTVPVPTNMAPERALLARLMGVSMTTLMTTAARPGDRVLVCGAGPVGFLAAHLFALAGYDIMVVEPDEARRRQVERSGLSRTFARVPVDNRDIVGTVALVVDCSGHEQSVLDGCAVVRQHGEVVLIGVPWRRQTDIYAHAILDRVFHNFVVLRSGWEWELPLHAVGFKWEDLLGGYNNSTQSVFSGFRKALGWLGAGRIPADGLSVNVDPRDPQSVYRDLQGRRSNWLFVVFDWSLLGKAQ